jgi:ankyrin repeat protein
VVELLLRADPKAVLDEDRDGMCPLSYVWDGYANGFGGRRDLKALLRRFEDAGEVQQQQQQMRGTSEGGQQQQQLQLQRSEELASAEKRAREAVYRSDNPALKTLQSKWKIVNNLLRAYFQFPLIGNVDGEESEGDAACSNCKEDENGKKRKWRILHAVSAIKCHHTLFLLARALHPEQAAELDENDLFPSETSRENPEPQSPSPEMQTVSNRTALHFAASSPLSGKDGRQVLKTLMLLNPSSTRQVDGYGSLPLHLMAENDSKVHWVRDGFRDVCESYMGGLIARDGEGRTPLHCAVSSGRCAAGSAGRPQSPTGQAIQQPQQQPQQQPVDSNAAPQPIPEPRDFDNAARNAASVILNLVLLNPTAASVADNAGRLPLHYVAERGEEWNNDAESILAAHPAAARHRAGSVCCNMLPLHMAASNPDARPSLLMNIVNANPRAASLTDGTGRLPLHHAVDSGRTAWDRGIESIYDAYRAAISTSEDGERAWTVLHTASASHSAGRDLIEKILSLNPAAASLADGKGRYPLHLACAAGRRWEEGGVRLLFEADPTVALTEDESGLLPFHIVAMRSSGATLSSTHNATGDDSLDASEAEANGNNTMEETMEEDLASLEVLFNLLIAQPSSIQPR